MVLQVKSQLPSTACAAPDIDCVLTTRLGTQATHTMCIPHPKEDNGGNTYPFARSFRYGVDEPVHGGPHTNHEELTG